MRSNVPPELLADLRAEVAELTTCFWIQKRNGQFVRGTGHDEDIIVEGGDSPDDDAVGTYRATVNLSASQVKSAADASIDNMEVTGGLAEIGSLDVSVADIEAKLLDGAAVEVIVINWRHPEHGWFPIRRGYLGEISRDSDGRYVTELRGLKQPLTQVFVRTYSERCQVKRFGDAECGFDLSTVTVTGTVTAVTNRRRFDVDLPVDSPPAAGSYYDGGEFTFTSGANATYMRELKRGNVGDVLGALSFWDVFPEDVQVGDAFSLSPGCNRLKATCQGFNNFVNFRGWGLLIPGVDALLKGPL